MTTKVIETSLPADPQSVRVARGLVEGLRDHILAEAVDDLKLLISEVVTNSIRHAGLIPGETVGVKIIIRKDVVRAEVTDSGNGFTPATRTPEDSGTRGWGLEVVEQLSSRWGVTNNSETTVWFEIDLAA